MLGRNTHIHIVYSFLFIRKLRFLAPASKQKYFIPRNLDDPTDHTKGDCYNISGGRVGNFFKNQQCYNDYLESKPSQTSKIGCFV